MGGLCSGPSKDGDAKEKKQGLAKKKNDLRLIESGREAYKQCTTLIKDITKSVQQQNIQETLVSEAF